MSDDDGSKDSAMSTADLARKLKIPISTIYRYVNSSDPDEYWPHLRISRYIRFTPEQYRAIVEKLEEKARRSAQVPSDDKLREMAQWARGLERLRRDRGLRR